MKDDSFIFLFLWSPGIAFPSQDLDAVVIDTFITRQARRERGKEYREARDVLVRDLTHDELWAKGCVVLSKR